MTPEIALRRRRYHIYAFSAIRRSDAMSHHNAELHLLSTANPYVHAVASASCGASKKGLFCSCSTTFERAEERGWDEKLCALNFHSSTLIYYGSVSPIWRFLPNAENLIMTTSNTD